MFYLHSFFGRVSGDGMRSKGYFRILLNVGDQMLIKQESHHPTISPQNGSLRGCALDWRKCDGLRWTGSINGGDTGPSWYYLYCKMVYCGMFMFTHI